MRPVRDPAPPHRYRLRAGPRRVASEHVPTKEVGFGLRDESLVDAANLPDPHVLAAEIADDLRANLEQIDDVPADLQARADKFN